MRSSRLQTSWLITLVLGGFLPGGLMPGCQPTLPRKSPALHRKPASSGVFIPIATEPIYHLLPGYDSQWQEQVREGIEMARRYWGGYGPVRVWVIGTEDTGPIPEVAKNAFIEEYCGWRTAGIDVTADECRGQVEVRFIDVAERGEPQAYLSWVDDFEQPEAELVFINVDRWYFRGDPIPDPVLRGIHEYTHVFQMAFGPMPTWMMEGGAVFSEAWIPWIQGRCDFDFFSTRMRHLLDGIQKMDGTGLSIADIEDIDTASPSARKHHRELAYDAGAWAFVFLIHRSSSRSVSGLREVFFPLIKTHGWEKALDLHLDINGKEDFYLAFEDFMEASLEMKLEALREIEP